MAADSGGGGDWFQPFVDLNAAAIAGIAGLIGSAGAAIVLYTVLLKVVTYPVTKATLRTNAVLQLVSPQREFIQRKYKDDEATSNKLQQRLFAQVDVNPLASLLPILVQFPLFIGLFRAIAQLAREDKRFTEGFLFVPSLAGPADPYRPSLDWMLKTQSAEKFVPLCGWDNLPGYVALPVIVVLSQLLAQNRSKIEGDSTQAVTGTVFPLVVGISCLVSPAGLGLYWLTNNLISTGLTAFVQGEVEQEFPEYKKIKDSVAGTEETRLTRDSEFVEESPAVVRSVEELTGRSLEMPPPPPPVPVPEPVPVAAQGGAAPQAKKKKRREGSARAKARSRR